MPRPEYDRPGGPWDVAPLSDLDPAGLVDGEVVLDHDEATRRVDLLADGLATRGVAHGDRVAWQLPNWWEATTLFHACWRLGAVAVPIHHRGGAALRHEIVARTGARLTLVAAHLDPADEITVRGDRDGFATLLDGASSGHPGRRQTRAPTPADDAVILATSGSTGRPKLVVHKHRGLSYKAAVMATAHGLRPDDAVLMPAPLSHISGLLNGVLLPAAAGMTTVLVDRWDAAEAVAIIATQRITFMIGPPTFFVDLATLADATDATATAGAFATLRLISCGGAGVTPAFVDRAAATFGARVKRTYGSTEAPTVTTWQPGDDPARAATTDGRPVGEVELRVDAPGDGPGRLQVRGPELFDRYLDGGVGPDADGWFDTGDLAHLDDGWLRIAGRADDTIVRGGENISPAEVEAACNGMSGIRHAIVVGYPDERLGERVGLVIEADREVDLGEVAAACAAAGLPAFKTPDRVRRVDILPRLDAGKPDRAVLAALFADRSAQG